MWDWGVIAENVNVWDGQRGVWQADRESQAVFALRTQRESPAAAIRGAEDLPEHQGQRFVSCCWCCLIDKSAVFGQCAEIESADAGCCVLYNLSPGRWWWRVRGSQWMKTSDIWWFKSCEAELVILASRESIFFAFCGYVCGKLQNWHLFTNILEGVVHPNVTLNCKTLYVCAGIFCGKIYVVLVEIIYFCYMPKVIRIQ